jgi:SHS2 domain-containing protein
MSADISARKTGRQLVALAKDAYVLEAMRCVDHEDRMHSLLLYHDLKIKKTDDHYEVEIIFDI